jgi:hypothetical protein
MIRSKENFTAAALIGSLMDGLTRDRMEVDMIKFSGPAFSVQEPDSDGLGPVSSRYIGGLGLCQGGISLEKAIFPTELEDHLFRNPGPVHEFMDRSAGKLRHAFWCSQDIFSQRMSGKDQVLKIVIDLLGG